MKKPLSNAMKWLMGIGSMLFIMSGTFHGYYLSYILTDVMRIPLENTAIITSVSSIGTLILATFTGFVLQMVKPGKMGRYRKACLILIILNFALIWTGYTKFTDNIALLTIILTITLSFTKWLNNVNTNARNMLVTEVAPDKDSRAMLLGHETIYRGLGQVLYSLVGVSLLAFIQTQVSEAASFPIVFEIFAGVAVLGYLFELRITKGYDSTADAPEAEVKVDAPKKKKPPFWATVKAAFSSLPLASISLAYMCSRVTSLMGSGLMVYYYRYVAEDTTLQTVAVTANSVLAMCNGIIGPFLVKRFGNKGTFMLCNALSLVGLAIVFLFGLNSAAAFSLGAVIVVTSLALSQIPLVSMFSDCAIYSEYRTGLENRAITMNMFSVFGTIGGFVRNWIQPLALAMSGYVAGEVASLEVKRGLIGAYVNFPAIASVLTLVLVAVGYRLKDSDVAKMEAEIAARHTGGEQNG